MSLEKLSDAAIKATLQLFFVVGCVIEIRVLNIPRRKGRPFVSAGWFDDLDSAVNAVRACEKRKPEGIYCTMNPVKPALLARSPNRMTDYPAAATTDADILGRRWLMIDCDSVRPSGVSSTGAELDAAHLFSKQVKSFLHNEMKWSHPVVAMSGNGFHLLYEIDLPNDATSQHLIDHTLAGLAEKFKGWTSEAGIAVKVDTAVSKASQLAKLYGTTVRKGFDTLDCPHRRSLILQFANPLQTKERK